MASDFCPSLFFVTPDDNTEPYNKGDIFMPDRFAVLQKDQTQIDKIVANTGADKTLQIRLLTCHLIKDLSINYCIHRKTENPRKAICSDEEIQNTLIHYNVKIKNTHDTEYFLAFIDGTDLNEDSGELMAQKLLNIISWLGITAKHIILKIFTTGRQPAFATKNKIHINNFFNDLLKDKSRGYNGNIECDVFHVKIPENLLTITLNRNYLSFRSSSLEDDEFYRCA